MKRTILKATTFLVLVIVMVRLMSIGFGGGLNTYTRLMMHDLEQETEIDYLLVGPSRIFRGINPFILEEKLGASVFNAGTSSQRVDDTYYLLKYAMENHDIKNVVYDLQFAGYSVDDVSYFHRTTPILKNMKPCFTKIMYASDVLDNPLYAFLEISNITTYRYGWTDLDFIRENFQRYFFNTAYRNYEYSDMDTDLKKYIGKGFISSKQVMEAQDYPRYPMDEIDLEVLEYLYKVIELCRENDCNLYVISMPVYPTYHLDNEAYWHDYFSEILQQSNVPYIDYATYPLSELGLTAEDYGDETHLNHSGAEVMTDHLAQWLMQQQ